MTENMDSSGFKAPIPPRHIPKPKAMPVYRPEQKGISTKQNSLSEEKSPYKGTIVDELNLSPTLLQTKMVFPIFIAIFICGLLFGKIFMGESTKISTQIGLTGVVTNDELKNTKRQRCGIAERTSGCILYIMNATRVDRVGRDFYKDAARITGVPEYTIELGNIEYGGAIIRPGQIAQINIPPR